MAAAGCRGKSLPEKRGEEGGDISPPPPPFLQPSSPLPPRPPRFCIHPRPPFSSIPPLTPPVYLLSSQPTEQHSSSPPYCEDEMIEVIMGEERGDGRRRRMASSLSVSLSLWHRTEAGGSSAADSERAIMRRTESVLWTDNVIGGLVVNCATLRSGVAVSRRNL